VREVFERALAGETADEIAQKLNQQQEHGQTDQWGVSKKAREPRKGKK
jgi:hypothetical protein